MKYLEIAVERGNGNVYSIDWLVRYEDGSEKKGGWTVCAENVLTEEELKERKKTFAAAARAAISSAMEEADHYG